MELTAALFYCWDYWTRDIVKCGNALKPNWSFSFFLMQFKISLVGSFLCWLETLITWNKILVVFSVLSLGVDESEEMDASSAIPLDDGMPIDFGAIEVVQCLMEQHNAIFTDANETVWRWLTILCDFRCYGKFMKLDIVTNISRLVSKFSWGAACAVAADIVFLKDVGGFWGIDL